MDTIVHCIEYVGFEEQEDVEYVLPVTSEYDVTLDWMDDLAWMLMFMVLVI